MRDDWKPISKAPPDTLVWTRVQDELGIRNQCWLILSHGLWMTASGIAATWTPTHFIKHARPK